MAGSFFNMKVAEHRAKGFSMEEAKRMAMADLDYNIQLTQQSSRREFQLDWQNSKVGKAFTQFAGPSYVRLGMEIEALHRMMYVEKGSIWDKTTARGKAFRNLVNKVVALHFLCPTALSLLGLGANSIVHKTDDDDWAKKAVRDWAISCVLGPFSGWFIGGSFLTQFSKDLTSKDVFGVNPSSLGTGNSPMISKLYSLIKRSSSVAKELGAIVTPDDFDAESLGEALLELLDVLMPIEKQTRRGIQNINEYIND